MAGSGDREARFLEETGLLALGDFWKTFSLSSPLEKGQAKSWACGIAHAVGMVNFLFDSSQTPHVSAKNLYGWFGVAESTGQGKSKAVRDTLKMRQLDPDWCLPSRVEDSPLIWMLSVNGLIMDIRRAPLGAQVEAYAKGLIPYIPGHKEDSDTIVALMQGGVAIIPPRPDRQPQTAKATPPAPAADVLQALYVLEMTKPKPRPRSNTHA